MESEKTRKSEKNTPADKRALKIFYNYSTYEYQQDTHIYLNEHTL